MHKQPLHRILASVLVVSGSLLTAKVSAAPAVVRVPEARILESAEPNAKVLQTLTEGAKVEVSESATDGRRSIKLPTGQEGLIDDAAVSLIKADPVAKKPEPARACDCPTKEKPAHMPVFIVDYGHLAELTKSDPDVLARAELLQQRADGAALLAHGGIGIGLGIATVGVLGRLTTGDWGSGRQWMAAGGVAMAAISAVAAWMYAPDHGDLAEALNLWNRRHPDKPLAP